MTMIQTQTTRDEHPAFMLWCVEQGVRIDLIGGGIDTDSTKYTHTWSIYCSEEFLTMFCLRWPAKILKIPFRSELEKT